MIQIKRKETIQISSTTKAELNKEIARYVALDYERDPTIYKDDLDQGYKHVAYLMRNEFDN